MICRQPIQQTVEVRPFAWNAWVWFTWGRCAPLSAASHETPGLAAARCKNLLAEQMIRTLASLCVVAAAACGGLWLFASGARTPLRADAGRLLEDSDDDFLPDAVEWAVLTSSSSPDTDEDGFPDFVEVVQLGTPRTPGTNRSLDHEMRVVVTSPGEGLQGPAWLHLLFRFVGSTSLLTSFQAWIESPNLPGVQIPLDMLGFSTIDFAQRVTAHDGVWVRLSVPMVSEAILRGILPCSIQASATIGSRTIRSGVKLFEVQGVVCTLTPFGDRPNRLVMQSIGALTTVGSTGSNRVCVLTLERAGSGPSGTVYEVVAAACEDCSELECGAGCPQSVGWVFSIPGGIETITGG